MSAESVLQPAVQAKGWKAPLRTSALDWLNFWMADVQTGVGPFVAAALTARGWNPAQVGTFLTAGGLTGIALQTPGGALVDATRRKRTLIGLGVAAIAVAAVGLAYGRSFGALLGSQIVLGAVGALIGPAITAITLGLVGRERFDARLGRNQSFGAAGNVCAALLMGWVGWRYGTRAIFLVVPLLAIPTLWALSAIPARQIDYARARGADDGQARGGRGLRLLLQDKALFAFATSAVLFHLANAAMLPQLSEMLARGHARLAAPFMSASVSITQLVIALSAGLAGKLSARWGPRRLLLFGFGVLPLRGVLYTLTRAVPLLLAIQVLDGIANAIFGVASAVYVAERTRGSGHFNLAMGGLATAVGIGASVSTVLAGFVAQRAGFAASFLVLAGIATAAFLCLWKAVPEANAR
ncbi:MAG TPA: MFS transporter [Bryobacteraceae bacterium]|nr:MFS transporter [Bryobacteraceae bacterium]